MQDPLIALFKKIAAGSVAPSTPSSTKQLRERSVPLSSAINKALYLLKTRRVGRTKAWRGVLLQRPFESLDNRQLFTTHTAWFNQRKEGK